MIRKELQYAKDSQRQFMQFMATLFSASIVAIGVWYQYISKSGEVFLVPLIALIPTWWIFISKAATITRAVAYIRIIENLLLGRITCRYFAGWENNLHRLREYEADMERKSFSESLKQWALAWRRIILFGYPEYRFWIGFNLLFLGIVWLCVGASFYAGSEPILLILQQTGIVVKMSVIALVVATVLTGWQFCYIYKLVAGDFSYNSYVKKWWDVLEARYTE